MSLKIVRAADPLFVEDIVIVVYGAPGLGKSTLGFSADAPILLDFDRGAYRAANRGDSVQVERWDDVTSITAEDLAEFKTVVVDTAGRALDVLSADIIRRNAKMGRGGALTLQGYGQLKSEFTAWLKMVKSMGKDVVLIAHSSEDKSGDDLIERLDVQGGSKGEIYKSADAMGRLNMINGKRILNFNPSDTSFGKNPGQLPALPVPEIAVEPQFLGGVIGTIKERLNSLSAAQQERQHAIAEWFDRICEIKSAEDANALVKECQTVSKDIQPTVKGALHKRAKDIGLVFESNGYRVAV